MIQHHDTRANFLASWYITRKATVHMWSWITIPRRIFELAGTLLRKKTNSSTTGQREQVERTNTDFQLGSIIGRVHTVLLPGLHHPFSKSKTWEKRGEKHCQGRRHTQGRCHPAWWCTVGEPVWCASASPPSEWWIAAEHKQSHPIPFPS